MWTNMNHLGNLLATVLRALLLRQCSVCQRRNLPTNPDADGWTIQHRNLILVGTKCPDCQTPEERAECGVEDAIGPKYRYEGLLLVKNPEDDGSQAQAS